MFRDKSNESSKRIKGMERMRNDIGWITLKRVVFGFEEFCDFLESGAKGHGFTARCVACKVKAVRCARQSTSNSLMGRTTSESLVQLTNLTLMVISSNSPSDQLCNQVSFSESGQRSSFRS